MSAQDELDRGDGHILLDGGRVGILLIHGLGGTPVELKFVAQVLNRAGHTVCCPLLVGHGGSDALLNTTTWMDWYKSVEEAHDALRERSDVIIVGGISAGVLLALHLAAIRPQEVHGTLLFSPTFWPNGWAIPRYFALFKLVRYKWFANLINLRECAPYGIKDERTRRVVLNSLQSDGRPIKDIYGRKGGTVLEFRWLAKTVEKELGQIQQPALIFHPRFDDQSDISNTILLQRKLGGLAEVVVLNDSYHMVTLDRQRADVADRSVAFSAWVAHQHERQQEITRLRRGVAGNCSTIAL
jgi:carboxylesterase